ncbi:hypothetical protein G4B88_004944 [Cannabis sativa]|uniref:DUF4283 domain-containing protein n=1 Tax=Cannabis sativa TaxID=3483 RepID=A0A7J6G248_CANSA|nr:hypothetical protein G4B88_004944 [Cannabis sativa]
MADNTLSHLFEEAVQVTTEDLTYRLDPGEIDTQEPQGKILLGKLICKGKLGRTAIAGTLKKAWASFKGWSWKEDDDGIIHFTFATKEDAWNVLQRRPWIICGALLVIMPWPSWLAPSEVKFDKTPIWVRISSIPPFYWNKTNLEELAAKVSPNYKLPRYIDFERGSFGMGSVRFRATIDIDKPLFSGFFMKRETIKDLWMQFKYEKLPKLCLKCGIISHPQKFCFKPPTVIKDSQGAYFPMFGTWMKHEEPARSPFSCPLPSWFEEWIIQKRLTVDQKFKQQWKMNTSLQIAGSWEARETRRQLPGKRRLVEQVVEELPETNELRVTRFPMVTLPGVGEVCPLEDTDTLVVCKNPENLPIPDPQKDKNDGDSTIDPQTSNSEHGGTIACASTDQASEEALQVQAQVLTPSSSSHSDTLPTEPAFRPKSPTDNSTLNLIPNPFGLGRGGKAHRPYDNLLGSQAHELPWPSKELWTSGYRALTGLGTVDKYLREPSLFNPLLDIEDFRSLESDLGPKKRKALDGISIGPSPFKASAEILTSLDHPTCEASASSILAEPSHVPAYSPGSSSASTSKRRRGRPSATNLPPRATTPSEPHETSPPPRRRGRPSKSSLGCNTNSFTKKKQQKSEARKRQNAIRANWENKVIDLKVDLSNHFVIVDCKNKPTQSKGPRSPSGTCLKRARLDRALASVDWRLAWPKAIVNHLSASTSDHSPILLDTEGGRSCSNAQFKYELMWERDPRVFWVVKNAWANAQHHNPMINMYRKIKITKKHLAKWNKNQFRNLSTQISKAHPGFSTNLTPPMGWICCTTDVSISTDHSVGAAVFRNSQNCIIDIFSDRFAATDPSLAEAQMLVSAACYAGIKQYRNIIFHCDNTTVVSFFNAPPTERNNFNLEGAAYRFSNSCLTLHCYKLLHIQRKDNFMAHNTAKWARLNMFFGDIAISNFDGEVLSDFQEWFPDPG